MKWYKVSFELGDKQDSAWWSLGKYRNLKEIKNDFKNIIFHIVSMYRYKVKNFKIGVINEIRQTNKKVAGNKRNK